MPKASISVCSGKSYIIYSSPDLIFSFPLSTVSSWVWSLLWLLNAMQKYKDDNSRSFFHGHCSGSALFPFLVRVSLIPLNETRQYHPNTEKLQLMKTFCYKAECVWILLFYKYLKFYQRSYGAEVFILMQFMKKREGTPEKLILKEMEGKKLCLLCAVQWFSGRPELSFRGPDIGTSTQLCSD